MKEVKHSFKAMSKRCLLVSDSKLMQHKAMLNEPSEVARFALADRLRDTIDVIGSKTRVAGACGVTEQAVTGWLKTGRIHKKHLPVIAGMAKRDLGWLLTGQEDAPSAPSTAADLATPPPGSRVTTSRAAQSSSTALMVAWFPGTGPVRVFHHLDPVL